MIKVIVNGAKGNMGQETVKALNVEESLKLVAETDLGDDFVRKIKETGADVVVDFTHPSCAVENTKAIILSGARPVIGTTGFTEQDIIKLQEIAKEKKMGGIIAPNFALGAVLMMEFSKTVAKYMPHVEIIEIHHDKKADSPSGTAIKTAQLISENRKEIPLVNVKMEEKVLGVRGGVKNNIHIHSIRIPGVVANQEVIFGGLGQTLTIKHETINRQAFMPGVIMAVKKVVELNELVYGLEKIL